MDILSYLDKISYIFSSVIVILGFIERKLIFLSLIAAVSSYFMYLIFH